MALKLKEVAAAAKAGKGHNGANRDPVYLADQCRELDRDLVPLEKQQTEINDQIKARRREFKKNTGIVQADFNAGRRLAGMEDVGEQREKMTNLKIAFNALSEGYQMDWLDPADKKKGSPK